MVLIPLVSWINSVLSNSQKVSLKLLEELKRGKISYCLGNLNYTSTQFSAKTQHSVSKAISVRSTEKARKNSWSCRKTSLQGEFSLVCCRRWDKQGLWNHQRGEGRWVKNVNILMIHSHAGVCHAEWQSFAGRCQRQSLNGVRKKLGSTYEFLCQRLLSKIIWVRYAAEKFKNFLIIKLHNKRCAKTERNQSLIVPKCNFCYTAGDTLVNGMDLLK